MPQLDDDDPPSFNRAVNTQVTMDMLTDQDLIDELVGRRRLTVLTAHRRVPREVFTKKDFYSAMRALLSCDLATRIVELELIGEDMEHIKDDLQFYAQIVVLNTVKEERIL